MATKPAPKSLSSASGMPSRVGNTRNSSNSPGIVCASASVLMPTTSSRTLCVSAGTATPGDR